MMWALAGLIVLTLGGVAAVAAGRGGPLAAAYDDRPDVVLPDGPVTADALRRVRFPLAFRGYRMAEVDALLDRVAAELEQQAAARTAEDAVATDPPAPDESRGEPRAE